MIAMIGGVVMKVDNELVIKASKGDKTAFSELYYSCYKDLYKFALYTLGDAEDAADVVSDTFVDIWKGIGKLRDEKSFSSWAFAQETKVCFCPPSPRRCGFPGACFPSMTASAI